MGKMARKALAWIRHLMTPPEFFHSQFGPPEKWWLEGRLSRFQLGETVTFQGRSVKLREGMFLNTTIHLESHIAYSHI